MVDKHDETARLRAMLEEDTGDADTYLPVVQMLRAWDAPATGEPISLIATLEDMAPEPMKTPGQLDRLRNWLPLLIMRTQFRIVQVEIWMASLLVMLVGVVVTLSVGHLRLATLDLPFVLLAPVVAACGICLLYSTDAETAQEIERTVPISWALLMMARLLIVFIFDLVLGVVGSLVITLVQPSVSLWPLVLAWLAPMAFLSALAFLISVASLDALLGVGTAFGLWIVLIGIRLLSQNPYLHHLLPLPDLISADARPWLLLLSVPIFLFALWYGGHRDFIQSKSHDSTMG